MTFKHKLSRRLSLLRGLSVATVVIAVACNEQSLSAPNVEAVNPSASFTTTFNAGDRVKTTGAANVRSGPTGSSALLGAQAIGALGTIVSGPVVDSTGDRP